MSTSASPFGFRPSRSNVGDVRQNSYPIASTYATSIYKGDPVLLGTDGTVTAVASSSGNGTAQQGSYLGIFQGCQSQSFVRGWSDFYPANTTATDLVALIYDSRDTIFEVQFGTTGTGTGLTQAAVGSNAGYRLGTPSALLGKSGAYVDEGNIGTGTGLPFKVLKFVDRGTNAPNAVNGTTSDAYPEVEVIWNVGMLFKDNGTGV